MVEEPFKSYRQKNTNHNQGRPESHQNFLLSSWLLRIENKLSKISINTENILTIKTFNDLKMSIELAQAAHTHKNISKFFITSTENPIAKPDYDFKVIQVKPRGPFTQQTVFSGEEKRCFSSTKTFRTKFCKSS